jgi:hypothetical protein
MRSKQSRLRVRRAPKVIAKEVHITEYQTKPERVPEHDPEGPTKPPKGDYRPIRQIGPPSSVERKAP